LSSVSTKDGHIPSSPQGNFPSVYALLTPTEICQNGTTAVVCCLPEQHLDIESFPVIPDLTSDGNAMRWSALTQLSDDDAQGNQLAALQAGLAGVPGM